jgi:ribose transport system ATP-binding protein
VRARAASRRGDRHPNGTAKMSAALLETRGLTKRYPGVVALDAVDFTLERGEVHVLFGENGAGKSTMIALLAGAQQPTAGSIFFNGQEISLRSVREARSLGISAVFQEFSLVSTLTVAQNLFLGEEPSRRGLLDRGAMARGAAAILADLGFAIDPGAVVGLLSRAEQQMVEIAKALRSELSVLILDEPTASLTGKETERLFELIDQLKRDGVGIIYISHRMQEIRRIGDRVTILRDGRRIATVEAASTPEDDLIEMMTGRAITEIYPSIRQNPGETLLELDELSTASGVGDATLYVRRGEVVGVAGLVGSGKSEAMRAAFGLESVTAGMIRFKGRDVTRSATPSRMLAAGMFYLPPDRKDEGLVLTHSSHANLLLPAIGHPSQRRPFGWVAHRAARARSHETAVRVDLATMNIRRMVGQLSGGNQQKVLFAKGLVHDVDLFIFDEPTVGVDVGTRSTLYGLIRDLCEAGAGVVVISSDLPEVLHLSHRLYVMQRGRTVAHLQGGEISESGVLQHFFEREEQFA